MRLALADGEVLVFKKSFWLCIGMTFQTNVGNPSIAVHAFVNLGQTGLAVGVAILPIFIDLKMALRAANAVDGVIVFTDMTIRARDIPAGGLQCVRITGSDWEPNMVQALSGTIGGPIDVAANAALRRPDIIRQSAVDVFQPRFSMHIARVRITGRLMTGSASERIESTLFVSVTSAAR